MEGKTNGTWQCKNCDATYQQVRRLNGDPTAATEEFYAAAAGKRMQETKRLWEHHANKYKYRAKGIDEVWCDACGQKCTLGRVRVKANAKGT